MVSTQLLPQRVNVPAHPALHFPCEQTSPAAHAAPQAPQFLASDAVAVHTPLQLVCPAAQPQVPFVQA
jgi:hypothetical protein